MFVAVVLACSCASCKNTAKTSAVETDTIALVGPTFSADSAYAFSAAQCAFGERTMNSRAHDLCGEWIMKKFASYGMTVEAQDADVKGWDGTTLHSRNIIARFRPEATTRILLCAHWDSRPWADNDPDSTNWRKPVMAANDGASGVAVMLEIARALQSDTTLKVGVDFVCFDAEDWGTPQWADVADDADTWALGAQHWATHLPEGYEARYGILLDMVGGAGSKFYQEGRFQAVRSRDCQQGMAHRCRHRLRIVLPDEGRRHAHRRPRSRKRKGRHPLHRHRSLLPRLPAKLVRSDMAHRERHDGKHRPQRAQGSRTDSIASSLF